MHSFEFITKGSVIASVGHWFIHFSHCPHNDFAGLSGFNLLLKMINPRDNQDPFFLLIKLLFFPIQPSPDSSAQAFSSKGDVSTQIFHLQSGI